MLLSLNVYCQNGMNLFNDAKSKHSSKDYEAAIAGYSAAIESESSPINLSVFYKFRGDAKLSLDDYSGAIVDYTKSESIYKHSDLVKDLLIKRAFAKRELKDYRGAIDDYTEYIDKSNYIISKMARGSSAGGNYTKEQNAAFERTYSLGYFYRGTAKLKLKDFSGALVDFDEALAIEPSYSAVFYSRGYAKLNLNKKQSACLDFSKAGELGYEGAYEAIGKYCQ